MVANWNRDAGIPTNQTGAEMKKPLMAVDALARLKENGIEITARWLRKISVKHELGTMISASMRIYSESDIAKLITIMKNQKIGRPRKQPAKTRKRSVPKSAAAN